MNLIISGFFVSKPAQTFIDWFEGQAEQDARFEENELSTDVSPWWKETIDHGDHLGMVIEMR